MECVPPCETGRMWWISCTGVSRPALRHISQRGCAAAYRSRIRRHAWPYFLLMSGLRSYLSYLRRSSMRCLSQYCPSQRFGQPGWEHGRFGLCGMRLLLSTTKATAGLFPTMALDVFFGIIIISHYATLFPSHFLSCFGNINFVNANDDTGLVYL